MEADREDQLKALFEQATRVPTEELAAFVERECGHDSGLRKELEAMLRDRDKASAYFSRLESAVRRVQMSGDGGLGSAPNIPRFEIGEILGQGGTSVVYRAYDHRLGRDVAIKLLHARLSNDRRANERFVNEARAASALECENICTIYDIGETGDGRTYVAMPCYSGETVKRKIARGHLSIDLAIDIALQMARGLLKAHGAGIIHRDIKPGNAIVLPDGVVKLLDFGLAKMDGVDLTCTGARMGTLPYMSPEQLRGEKVDHRTDLWSLGVVLYEMLSGQRPFNAEYDAAYVYSILNIIPADITALRSDLPPPLNDVVRKALRKERDARYDDAAAFMSDLAAVDLTRRAPASMPVLPGPQPGPGSPATVHDAAIGAERFRAQLTRCLPILVVDDAPELELLMLQKFSKRLNAGEWEFRFASDGEEALRRLHAEEDLELVLTDIRMPGMDGLTLVRKLAELERPTKAVVITAYGDMQNIRTAMNGGAFDFVTKPIDFEDLEITILKAEHDLRSARMAAEAYRQLRFLKNEMEVAERLREAVAPDKIQDSRVDLYAFHASGTVGPASFYDHFRIDDDRIAVLLGEVGSRGLAGTVLGVGCRIGVRSAALSGKDPTDCLHFAKEVLLRHDMGSIKVLVATMDVTSGQLAVANAGMPNPRLLGQAADAGAFGDYCGRPLTFHSNVDLMTKTVEVASRDCVILVSDMSGITSPEWPTSGDVVPPLTDISGASAAEITRAMMRRLNARMRDAENRQDVSVLTLRRPA